MDDGSEFLAPWSADGMLMTLEHVDTGDPATDDLWGKRKKELLSWMSRRPDVAARTLMCLLFSIQPVKAFDAKESERPVTSLLHSMATHTLSRSREVTTQPRAPLEEVSMAASFMEDYTQSLCPDLQKVLSSLLQEDDTADRNASHTEEIKTTLLATTPGDLIEDHERLLAEAAARLQQHVSALPSEPPPQVETKKRVLLLRRPATEDSDGVTAPMELVSLADRLPPCIASSDHYLLQQMSALRDADERAQLDTFVAAAPLPLAARSLEEMASLAHKKEEAQQNATVIRTREEERIAQPQWAKKQEAEGSHNSSSSSSSTSPESDTDAPTAAEGGEAAKKEAEPAPPNEEVNLIENKKGVTVLLTHKGVIFKEKRRRAEKRERPPAPATTDQSAVVKTEDTSVAAAEHPATDTSAEGGGVELKSREELRRLVSEWKISSTLLDAVMIGLEPPPSVVQLPEDYRDE